jgi:hypothetical protein
VSVDGVVVTCALGDVVQVWQLMTAWEESGARLPETFSLDRSMGSVRLYSFRDGYGVSQALRRDLLTEFHDPYAVLESAAIAMAHALSERSGEVPSHLFPRGLSA